MIINLRKGLILLTICFFLQNWLFAQTQEQKQEIKNKTNVKVLKEKARQYEKAYESNMEKALELAKENGWIIRSETEERTIELQGVTENGRPVYYITTNVNAAQTISTDEVHPGGYTGFNLDGENMLVGEWDGGDVREPHQEFTTNGTSRVTDKDANTGNDDHATHVAGTMIAAGVDASAKGMAFKANLDSYGWGNDNSEMANAASNGLLLSNHSYGTVTGWYYDDNANAWQWAGNQNISSQEDYRFGFYSQQSQQWDQIAYNAPYYLICHAAGNDRGDGTGSGSFPPDGGDDGYDCIPEKGNAKNTLTVGAVNDLPEGYQGSPEDVDMSSFSSWGPADDGRIKPDIVANGVNLYSTSADTNSAYTTKSGTSMATPSVTGSLLLLQELYNETYDVFMKSATLKALAVHTADEAGDSDGPDYKFGWGLLNTESAAEVISNRNETTLIKEKALSEGGSYTINVAPKEGEPLIATLVWTDVPGSPVSPQLDPIAPMLVNDLDVIVTNATSGDSYQPYKLDGQNPDSPATTGDNDTDNVEKIVIEDPANSEFTIKVDHDGNLNDAPQNFSLIVSGIDVGAAVVKTDSVNNVAITAADAYGHIGFDNNNPVTEKGFVYSTSPEPTLSDNVVQGSGTGNFSAQLMNLMSSTTYYVKAYAINAEGLAYGSSVEFTTMSCTAYTMPYEEHFAGQVIPVCWNNYDNEGSGQIWQAVDTSYTLGGLPGGLPDQLNSSTAGNGYAVLDSRAFGYGSSQDADLISPPFDFSGDSSVVLSFEHQYVYQYDSDATLLYTTDGGSTWKEAYSWGNDSPPTPEIINGFFALNLSSKVVGESNVHFKWNYSATYDYWWALDDIQVKDSALTIGVSTDSVSNITSTSADLHGSVAVDSASTVSETGFVYAEHNTPTVDDTKLTSGQGQGPFMVSLQNLDFGTTYYFRAYTKTTQGIAYGNVIAFTPPCTEISTFPYVQDFSAQELPACWQNYSSELSDTAWQFVDTSYEFYENSDYIDDDEFNASTAHNGFALVDGENHSGFDTLEVNLVSREFNFTGHDSVQLSFEHHFETYFNDSVEMVLYYSKDAGNSWNTLQSWDTETDNPATYTENLSGELAGEPDVFFKWRFYCSNIDYLLHWALDDIEVATNPNAPPQVQNPVPDTTFNTGFTSDTLYLDFVFNDPEGDSLSYAANSSDTSVVTTAVNNDSTLVLQEQGNGASTITLTAEDAYGNSTQDSFELSVGNVTEPDIEVIQNQIIVNEPDSGYIDITNTGNEFLEIYSVFSYENYLSSDTSNSYSIGPGDTSRRHILVSWQDVTTVDTGQIYVHSNDPQQDTVSVMVIVNPNETQPQEIPLVSGWNLFSMNVTPDSMNMMNIVEPLTENGNLVKVIDEGGNIIQQMPWGWVNNIGAMSPTEGYYVKVMDDQTMTVSGAPVELPYDIPLLAGWNISGYPAMSSQSAEDVLSDLMNAGILIKAIDEEGNIIEELPGGWVNNIGTFEPGEGYHIKVSQDDTLTITEPSGSTGSLPEAYVAPEAQHFEPVYEGNPYDPMQVVVNTNALNLQEGDELALLSEGSCVGAAGYKPSQVRQYLTASKDDPTTTNTDGFAEGTNVVLKVYRKQSNQVQLLPYETVEGPGSYSGLSTLVVEAVNLETGAGNASRATLTLGQNRPNPFTGETGINYSLPEKGQVKLNIYNLHGQKQNTVVEKTQQTGTHSVTVNSHQLSPGVYIYRLTYTNIITQKQQTRMHKMTILK